MQRHGLGPWSARRLQHVLAKNAQHMLRQLSQSRSRDIEFYGLWRFERVRHGGHRGLVFLLRAFYVYVGDGVDVFAISHRAEYNPHSFLCSLKITKRARVALPLRLMTKRFYLLDVKLEELLIRQVLFL
jgi:hypothetical protein